MRSQVLIEEEEEQTQIQIQVTAETFKKVTVNKNAEKAPPAIMENLYRYQLQVWLKKPPPSIMKIIDRVTSIKIERWRWPSRQGKDKSAILDYQQARQEDIQTNQEFHTIENKFLDTNIIKEEHKVEEKDNRGRNLFKSTINPLLLQESVMLWTKNRNYFDQEQKLSILQYLFWFGINHAIKTMKHLGPFGIIL